LNADGTPPEVNVFPKALFFTTTKTLHGFLSNDWCHVICLAAAVLLGTGVGSTNSCYDKNPCIFIFIETEFKSVILNASASLWRRFVYMVIKLFRCLFIC